MNLLLSSKYKDTANSSKDKITVQIFSVLANYLCVGPIIQNTIRPRVPHYTTPICTHIDLLVSFDINTICLHYF